MTRRGLVLGAGGVLGYNWLVAALATWTRHSGLDPRGFDVLIGTSAGSVAAAAVGSGLHPEALLRHLRGEHEPGDPSVSWDHDRSSGGALPPLPGLGLGSPALALRVLRHPRAYPLVAGLSAFALRGRGSLAPLQGAVRGLTDGGDWPVAPRTRIVAMDYDRGRRVVFGSPSAPAAELAEAVAASCAIPGWYAPVEIGGHRYVDGGVCSTTSVDLLIGEDLDEVTVLMPLGIDDADDSWHPLVRTERCVRGYCTRRTRREVAKLRATGTRVTVLTPDPDVLAAMGWNVMDHRRRRAVLDVSLRTTASAWERGLEAA
ncbi:MAG TPA: patatin-like phospholipase family protein [Pseudonocardiaceae bacterium]